MIRLLVANKRNYPLALCRPSMREKGRLFSPYAVMMRCFRGNHLASLINVHYLENASMVISIQVCEFFVIINDILRVLRPKFEAFNCHHKFFCLKGFFAAIKPN